MQKKEQVEMMEANKEIVDILEQKLKQEETK